MSTDLCFPDPFGGTCPVATGRMSPSGASVSFGVFRLPTDPLYYADVDVKNMVVGSRWAIGYDDSGTFTILDEGDCAATDFTIPGVPAYSSSFLLELRVRKGTTAPKYKPYKTYAYHSQQGATIYVSQVSDPVA